MTPQHETDVHFMRLALSAAQQAQAQGEVPVGAVVVRDGQVIATGHNQPIGAHDPSAHAEMVALRAAAHKLGNYRLDDCTLYVTLEPCTMCAGAVLQARLARVVYGAAEPKTGAAGSVLDVLGHAELNRHTAVQGGVLALESAALLQRFFQSQRIVAKPLHPLRDDALRTPQSAFAHLPDYRFAPHYVNDLPALGGLRLHWVDESGQGAAAGLTFLCLHGNPTWSYLWRHWVPVLTANGHRVVAPDLIGFGQSDKPKKEAAHDFDFHRTVLLQLIERLDLRRVVLVGQDWGGMLGLTLPMACPERFVGVCAMNTLMATGDAPLPAGFVDWRTFCRQRPHYDVAALMQRAVPHLTAAECAAYAAPFPDAGHRAALRALPNLVPDQPDAPGAALSRQARAFWRESWQGRSWCAVGAQDPVFGLDVMQSLQGNLRGAAPLVVLHQAGHFSPDGSAEQSRALAEHVLAAFSDL